MASSSSSSKLFMPKKKRAGPRATTSAVAAASTSIASTVTPPNGSTTIKTDTKAKPSSSASHPANENNLRPLSQLTSRSSTVTPKTEPPRKYRDYIIYSAGTDDLTDASLDVMRIVGGNPSEWMDDNHTIHLNRKDPTAEPPKERRENKFISGQRYQLDPFGKPLYDSEGKPVLAAPRVEADTSLIAPHGGAQAAAQRSIARAKSGRKAFQKQRQVKQRYNGGDPLYWQGVNQEKLPWVLDVEIGGDGEDVGVERWLGRVERQEGTGYAAMVLHWGGEGEDYAEMYNVGGDYRFDRDRGVVSAESDVASKQLENAMAFKVGGSRWAARPAGSSTMRIRSTGNDASHPMDVDGDRKPVIKRESSRLDIKQTGLAARLDEMMLRKEVKPRIKKERFDDEDRGRGRTRGPGLERLEGEDLDFDEGKEYQDDEEGFQVGIEEEQEAKELEARNKIEFDRANKNVGVLQGSDSDSDDDLFGDKEDEKNKRKTKRLLAKRGGAEDDDSSSEEYLDSDDESSDDGSVSDATAQPDGESPAKPGSRASRSDTGRSPSPSRTGSPSITSPVRPNSKPERRRSESPDLGMGHGQRMLAQRAISPGRSRAASPIGQSRSKERESGLKASTGSRKRKSDNRERHTAPAEGSSRESTAMPSKKHRPNTDHGTSSALSPESASYLPSPSTYDSNEPVHRQAAGFSTPQHKRRGKAKKSATPQPADELQDFPDGISITAFKDFIRSKPRTQAETTLFFRPAIQKNPLNNKRLRMLIERYTVADGGMLKLSG